MDEHRDKEMARNQMIAFALMIIAVFAVFKFFPPIKPPAQAPVPQVQQEQPAQEPLEAPARPAPEKALNPLLPPAPVVTDPAAEEVAIGDDDLQLIFTRIGARLKEAAVVINHGSRMTQQLVPLQAVADTEAVYPMGLRFSDNALGEELNSRRWEAVLAPDGRSVTFTLQLPGQALLRKQFSMSDKRHVVNVQIDYQNLAGEPQILGMDQTPAYCLYWGPNVASNDEKLGVKQAVIWHKDRLISSLPTADIQSKTAEPFMQTIPAPDWLGLRSTYFLVAIKPEFEGAQGLATGEPQQFKFGACIPRFEVAAGAVQSNQFSLYVGPMERKALRAAWPTLASALQFFQAPWGFMDWFAKLLLDLLNWFYRFIPNYGLAIIFLTVLVRTAMFPLMAKSMKSMKKMQMLAPELQSLKEKHGEDQQELQKKMMELYRERGVNPMGGCLPMLLQMPVWIALYRMLWNAYELRGAPFLWWIQDLSQPDTLLHVPALAQIPLLGIFANINVLPVLMGLSMVLSQKMTPMSGPVQNQQQKMMMIFMPIFFSFICYNMASGLNLYILTSTLLGMVQQKLTTVGDVDLKPKKKRTVFKRQHFYTAAQARKRQAAKEARKEKKRK